MEQRSEREGLLGQYVQNEILVAAMLSQAPFPYAGDGDDAPPMRPISLQEMADRLNELLRDQKGVAAFIFQNEKFTSSKKQTIRAPEEHLWWLAAKTDKVLLSDGVTHHLTTVSHVDRELDRVFFFRPVAGSFLSSR